MTRNDTTRIEPRYEWVSRWTASVPVIKHYLNCTVLNTDEENDNHSEDDSSLLEPGIQSEEFDSFTTDETDRTYQTEDSNHYADTLTTRRYITTLREIDTREPIDKKEHVYDNSSSIYERL